MMQQLAGTDGLASGIVAEQASVFGQLNPTYQRELHHMYQSALARRGICVLNEAPAPMSMTGLADALERKFAGVCAAFNEGTCVSYYGGFGQYGCTDPADAATCVTDRDPELEFARAEMMRKYIAQRTHYAVMVHEMGHSIGERHNFVSSSDAFNYRPQYWQLRTNDGAETTPCTDYDASGSCVGPRYFDPVTEHESDNLIWMWMHSSVMDYAGEITQDFLGLGAYDMAAHRMFYGENVAVYMDQSYAVGTDRGIGVVDKISGNFGGILGIQPTIGLNGQPEDIHYSQIQNNYEAIFGCQPVNDVMTYRPDSWDDARMGAWDPILDGMIVRNRAGDFTKCRQPKVDYVSWRALRMPSAIEAGSNFYRGGPSIDPTPQGQGPSRVRVPYGFATDSWADLGNASVYRHDNGADVYEIFNFLATQQEVQHIFANYRNGKQAFSVRSAANRILRRYNEKIRDGAKGLGLLRKWYQDVWAADGAGFSSLWGWTSRNFFAENLLASGMVFDHFAMNYARPEVGPHYREAGTDILRSDEDATLATQNIVNIPNGATGAFGVVSPGGKLVENRLSEDQGEFDRDFTMNAGSYYDKIYAPMLFTESVDNFISDSRNDFVNGRYRAVSLADLFPEGYRRWLANNLTGDDFIKGARIAGTAGGNPIVDFNGDIDFPIGWTTWWGDDVRTCFPAEGTVICDVYNGVVPGNFSPQSPDTAIAIDPQVGWEQHKFLIAMTMMYLPEDQQLEWINQMSIFKNGLDIPLDIGPYIELHDPDGVEWIARTYGRETIFGKEVQRGVAARMLEYANELLNLAYENTPVDYDLDGKVDWYEPHYGVDGLPIVEVRPEHRARGRERGVQRPAAARVRRCRTRQLHLRGQLRLHQAQAVHVRVELHVPVRAHGSTRPVDQGHLQLMGRALWARHR